MQHVILPQAIRRMTPAIVSQLVTLLKDTSLAYFVQYEELLRRAQLAGNFDRNLLQVSIAVALVYIAVNFCLGRIARRLEVPPPRRLGAAPVAVAPPRARACPRVSFAVTLGPGRIARRLEARRRRRLGAAPISVAGGPEDMVVG